MSRPRLSPFRGSLGAYLLMGALFAALGLTLLYPIALTIGGAFIDTEKGGFTFKYLLALWNDPMLVAGVKNALTIAATTTVLATIIALPLAFLGARYSFPFKGLFAALVLVPLILPPFVGSIGVQALLGRYGVFNTLFGTTYDFLANLKFWGVVGVQAFSLYPIIYLNATAALANLDPALDEAAENLGAGAWTRFRRVTFPLIRPGLFAGATIVFIWSFTELGTPLVFEYNTVTSVQIFNGLKAEELRTSPQPFALTFVLLSTAVLIYAVGKSFLGGRAYAMYSKASRAGGEKRLGGMGGVLAAGAFALVTALALLPHAGVIMRAVTPTWGGHHEVFPSEPTLANFQLALSHPDAFGSIVNSLKLSTMAVVIDLVVGILVAYVIVRTKIKGRWLLDGLCMLPLAVPGLVMAFGFAAMSLRWPFGKGDPLEGWVSIYGAVPNPVPLLAIAYAVRRLPYIVRSAVAGLEQTSGELEEAAMNLGASRVTAVRRVILPLIMANLIAGALLAFSFAMLEVSDSLLLAQQQKDYPITKAIYSFLGRLGDGPFIASAMGVWGMALLTVTLVGASILIGKKMGSIFRV